METTKDCKTVEKSARIVKPSDLVLSAIRHLNDRNGSSPREIINYLHREYDCPLDSIERCVSTALKRGLKNGMLNCDTGLYSLASQVDDNNEDVVDACCPRKRRRRVCKKRRRRSCVKRRKRSRPKKRRRSRSCRRKRRTSRRC